MTSATEATREAHAELLARLPFDDTTDRGLTERGSIAPLPDALRDGVGFTVAGDASTSLAVFEHRDAFPFWFDSLTS